MSGSLTNEMSAFKAEYGNMRHINREAEYGRMLSDLRAGAGYEGAGSDTSGNVGGDPLDRRCRDSWYIRPADEAMEDALRDLWLRRLIRQAP